MSKKFLMPLAEIDEVLDAANRVMEDLHFDDAYWKLVDRYATCWEARQELESVYPRPMLEMIADAGSDEMQVASFLNPPWELHSDHAASRMPFMCWADQAWSDAGCCAAASPASGLCRVHEWEVLGRLPTEGTAVERWVGATDPCYVPSPKYTSPSPPWDDRIGRHRRAAATAARMVSTAGGSATVSGHSWVRDRWMTVRVAGIADAFEAVGETARAASASIEGASMDLVVIDEVSEMADQ